MYPNLPPLVTDLRGQKVESDVPVLRSRGVTQTFALLKRQRETSSSVRHCQGRECREAGPLYQRYSLYTWRVGKMGSGINANFEPLSEVPSQFNRCHKYHMMLDYNIPTIRVS